MTIQLTDGTCHLALFWRKTDDAAGICRWLFTRCHEARAEFRLQECVENARNG